MGTLTIPSTPPSPGGYGNIWGGGANEVIGSGTQTMPQNGWVDAVHFYTGGQGGSFNFIFALYGTATGGLLAQTPSAAFNGKQWAEINFSLNSSNNNSGLPSPNLYLASGFVFIVGSYSSGGQNFGINNGVNTWYQHVGTGVVGSINGWSGWSNDPFGNNGDCYWYVEYFPSLTVTGIPSSPVTVGQVISITGQSFSAGVNSINIGPTNVPTFTVTSDTNINATIPAGASSNTVQVIGNAGAMTSVATLTISGAYYRSGGVVYPTKGIYYKTGGVLQPVQVVYYKSGGVLNPSK